MWQGGYEWDHTEETPVDRSDGSMMDPLNLGDTHKEGLTYFHAPHETGARVVARLVIKHNGASTLGNLPSLQQFAS